MLTVFNRLKEFNRDRKEENVHLHRWEPQIQIFFVNLDLGLKSEDENLTGARIRPCIVTFTYFACGISSQPESSSFESMTIGLVDMMNHLLNCILCRDEFE